MVLSFIAAAAGAAGGSSIVAWRGKRDMDNSIKALDEKLTKLEMKIKTDPEDAVNTGDREKLPPHRIDKDQLTLAERELEEIEAKVYDMEKRIKVIPGDELISIGDDVRHLLHVEVKEAVEKILSITGIPESQAPPFPGILDNMSIAKRWLQNIRKALDIQAKQIKS